MISLAQLMYEAAAAVAGETASWDQAPQAPWEAAARVVLDGPSDAQGAYARAWARSACTLLSSVAHNYYWNPALTYHNWNHVQAMLTSYQKLWGTPHPEMHMAIVWHDAVYVPRAPDRANEDLSALAFRHEYARRFADTSVLDVEFVCEMIRATCVSNHVAPDYKPVSKYIARLLDVDLNSLATDYQAFVTTQDLGILEQKGALDLVNIDAYRGRRAEFLMQFVADERPFIYHTTEAREAFEERARYNILRYNDEH